MGILDRIQQLARAGLGNLSTTGDRGSGRSEKPLAELSDSELEDEILRRRRERAAKRGGAGGAAAAGAGSAADTSARGETGGAARKAARSPQDQQIAQYYANLELPVGASLEDVRKQYREMMRRYHPDKHLGDPERHKAATALAQSLTNAYQALLAALGGNK